MAQQLPIIKEGTLCQKIGVKRQEGVGNGMIWTQTCIPVCTTSLTCHVHMRHPLHHSSDMLVIPKSSNFP